MKDLVAIVYEKEQISYPRDTEIWEYKGKDSDPNEKEQPEQKLMGICNYEGIFAVGKDLRDLGEKLAGKIQGTIEFYKEHNKDRLEFPRTPDNYEIVLNAEELWLTDQVVEHLKLYDLLSEYFESVGWCEILKENSRVLDDDIKILFYKSQSPVRSK